MSLPETYTTAEVAKSLRRSVDWLYDQVKAGKVNPARASEAKNGRLLWTSQDVERLLAALRPPAAAPTGMRRTRRKARTG